MDKDVAISNIFIDLSTKGTLSDVFLGKEVSLKDISIERKVHPTGKSPFPADIILFSRKYTYFLVIEVKNTTTTGLDVSQADSYSKLAPADTFNYVADINPSQIRYDISYLSDDTCFSHVTAQLTANNYNYPVLCVDLTSFWIGYKTKTRLNVPKISRLFNDGIQLNISSLEEIPKTINYGTNSLLSEIARLAATELIAQVLKNGQEIATSVLTEHSFSNISLLWNRIDPNYKKNLISRVKAAIRELMSNGVDQITIDGDMWSIDIFDTNQKISIAKLTKAKESIQAAVDRMDGQPTLFE